MRGHEINTGRDLLPAAPRLLLIRLDNIGDVILLSPAVAALRAAWPQAQLTLLASPAGAQGAALIEGIDRVIEHRASWQQLQPGAVDSESERVLLERLREEAFDAAFVFTSFSQDAVAPSYLCYLAGIPVRVAYAPDGFAGEVITHPVPREEAPPHQADRNLHLLRSVGIDAPDPALHLRISADVEEHRDRLLEAAGVARGAPFVALVPGASAPARRYERARFAEVARRFASEGLPVVVLGSDREAYEAGELEAEAGAFGVVSFAGRTSVPLLAAVLSRAAVAITNNSLALHLADALGVPVAATYGGTDPAEYWRPRVVKHRLLRREVGCSPCFRIECDRGHECMDIEPREVVLAAEELLAPIGVRAAERKSQ